MRGDADATESRTSVPGLAGKDFREGNEASENRPDLLSFDQHQPNGTTARDADHVHNSGISVSFLMCLIANTPTPSIGDGCSRVYNPSWAISSFTGRQRATHLPQPSR